MTTAGTRPEITLPFIKFLLWSKCYVKCFTCIISFHPHRKPESQHYYPHFTVEKTGPGMRTIGQETTATEEVVCYSQFPRGGGHASHAGHRGKHQGWSGTLSSRREHSWGQSWNLTLLSRTGTHDKEHGSWDREIPWAQMLCNLGNLHWFPVPPRSCLQMGDGNRICQEEGGSVM